MATGIRREMLSHEYQSYKALEEIISRLNKGELDYLPTKKKEQIAMLAAQHGMDYNVKSKPIKKGLFDFVDTALFGMVPNKWRPKSIGEDYFGESRADRISGAIGSVAGFGTGAAGVFKGAKAVKNLWNMRKATKVNKIGLLNPRRDVPLLGDKPNLLQLNKPNYNSF